MSSNFIQEELSMAYVRAVIFGAGFNLTLPVKDLFGIDGTVISMAGGVNRVDFQLKATTNFHFSGNDVLYDLRVEDYNRLVKEDDVPRVLILYVMPRENSEWIVQNRSQLCLRECAYWVSLMGKAPSRNASTVRVYAPAANVFDQNGLQNMFRQLVFGG